LKQDLDLVRHGYRTARGGNRIEYVKGDTNMNMVRKSGELVGVVLLVLTAILSSTIARAEEAKKADSLYIGDQTDPDASDNTIKRFGSG
jgi:hypothetical protein